jgi:hypothetical protein
VLLAAHLLDCWWLVLPSVGRRGHGWREDGGIGLRATGWRGALAAILAGTRCSRWAVGMVAAAFAYWGRPLNTARQRRLRAMTAPAPRLQTAPQPERAAYFAEKQQRLDSAGWVDRGAGIARIFRWKKPCAGGGAQRGGRHEALATL